MAAISLNLPDDLAKESKQLAESIGISRTELIRRALRHELDDIKAQLERQAMAGALEKMRRDPEYLRESERLDQQMSEQLAEEADGWWRG